MGISDMKTENYENRTVHTTAPELAILYFCMRLALLVRLLQLGQTLERASSQISLKYCVEWIPLEV